MTKRWLNERRNEHYYREAKRLNYRSRAAFKLQQIDDRFNVLRQGMAVVDLGAAPGGWLQVARERVGDGEVIGVDLQGIRSIEGVRTIKGDITSEETVARLLNMFGRKADVVISDMAPNISGEYSLDHARSIDLCYHALGVVDRVLIDGGSLVIMGDMFKMLRRDVEARFEAVKVHSPKASRKASSEVYIIAKGYRSQENDKSLAGE